MNVLVISNAYPTPHNSAAGIFIKEQVRELGRLGVKIRLAVKPGPSRLAYVPFFLDSLRCLLLGRYDMVHAHFGFYSALVPAILKRKPLVITFHGSDALIDVHRSRIYEALQRFVVKRSEWLIAVSRQVADALIHIVGASPTRVSVIACGVRTDMFCPVDKATGRQKLGISGNSKVVIFIGKFKRLKGIDVLLEAAKMMPEVCFIIVGDSKVDGVPANCRLLGSQPHEKIPELLSVADVLALPSRSEGTPVVILEALACGIPVVASRVGGIPDVIRDGETGYLVEPGNVDILVDKLRCVLNDPEKAKQMGRAGRELVVKSYDEREIAKRVLEVYNKVLGG